VPVTAGEGVQQVDLVAGGRLRAAVRERKTDAAARELGGIGLREGISGKKHPHLRGLRGRYRGEEKCEGSGETRSPRDHLGAGVGGPFGAGTSGARRGGGAGLVVGGPARDGGTHARAS